MLLFIKSKNLEALIAFFCTMFLELKLACAAVEEGRIMSMLRSRDHIGKLTNYFKTIGKER
ncbi:MAG: hypothetical protein FD173_2154 [Gallionellaceae bacterium]|nr:MAG: hypothetical protein FD173_2154 [Gallionellaceae bacterium]